jgi:hypothetical protein
VEQASVRTAVCEGLVGLVCVGELELVLMRRRSYCLDVSMKVISAIPWYE